MSRNGKLHLSEGEGYGLVSEARSRVIALRPESKRRPLMSIRENNIVLGSKVHMSTKVVYWAKKLGHIHWRIILDTNEHKWRKA